MVNQTECQIGVIITIIVLIKICLLALLYEKTDSTRNVFKDVSNEILRLGS